jgi:molybdenum cofactor cytidylyltransferase
LDAGHLKKMFEEFEQTKSQIVASFYSGRNGVPVLFHKSLFPQLLTIDDRQGAKKIIEQNPVLVKSVDFPNGAVDLDTPGDLKEFQSSCKIG